MTGETKESMCRQEGHGERALGPLKTLFFSFIVIITGLIALEGGLRLFGVQTGERHIPFQPDPRFGWIYEPHYHGFWHGADVSINSLGIREKELSTEKAPNTYRLLCLGDSVTFGYGTENDRTYVRVLESLLREHRPNQRFEAINAGIGGFSTLQELLFLKEVGLKFKPDLVIVAFVLNDVLDVESVKAKIERAKHLKEKENARGAGWKDASLYGLFRGTALYRMFTVAMAWYKKWDEAQGAKNLVANPNSPPQIEKNWEEIEQHLREINDLADESGFRVLLVIFPFRFQVEGKDPMRTPQDRLLRFGKEIGMPTLDLLPIFRKEKGNSLFIDTNHPTTTGHRLAAETIYSRIEAEGLLP